MAPISEWAKGFSRRIYSMTAWFAGILKAFIRRVNKKLIRTETTRYGPMQKWPSSTSHMFHGGSLLRPALPPLTVNQAAPMLQIFSNFFSRLVGGLHHD